MRSEHLTKTDIESLKWVSIPLKFILEDKELRLNAGSYSLEYLEAVSVIESLRNKGYVIEKLGRFAEDIFYPTRFKRVYTTKQGIGFLMPTDVFQFFIKPRKFIKNPPKIASVKKNWLLITRSGSVGRTLITNSLLEKYCISDDIIRFIPKKEHLNILGYIYAWLNTKYGQALLTKNLYGATVKHIEPRHIAELPIPRIPEDKEREIHESIIKAHKLREEAQKMLMEAEELFYKELKLPRLDEELIEYFGGEKGREVKAFTIKSSELEDRLDAGYYVPIFKAIVETLKEKRNYDISYLGSLVENIFIPPRFKRPYVASSKFGIKYIRPSDLPLIRYFEPLYLAKEFKNSYMYIFKRHQILIVVDGNVGEVSLVTSYLEGLYGSNNIARITLKRNINAGFLVLYLMTTYGSYQLKRKIYGGVIPHLTEEHIKNIIVPVPPEDIQGKIGSLVISAYEKKDLANKIEQEAVERLENIILKMSTAKK